MDFCIFYKYWVHELVGIALTCCRNRIMEEFRLKGVSEGHLLLPSGHPLLKAGPASSWSLGAVSSWVFSLPTDGGSTASPSNLLWSSATLTPTLSTIRDSSGSRRLPSAPKSKEFWHCLYGWGSALCTIIYNSRKALSIQLELQQNLTDLLKKKKKSIAVLYYVNVIRAYLHFNIKATYHTFPNFWYWFLSSCNITTRYELW